MLMVPEERADKSTDFLRAGTSSCKLKGAWKCLRWNNKKMAVTNLAAGL